MIIPAAALYARQVRRLRRRGDRWPPARSVSAAAGLVLTAAATLPPLADAMSFPEHVAMHLQLAMAAPLLLALSAPVTLALRTLPARPRRRLLGAVHSRPAQLLLWPPLIVLLDVGGMYVYYLTPLFAAAHLHGWLHLVVHAHMFLAGCLVSWYLLGQDPLAHRPRPPTRLLVLFLTAGAHDVLAKQMYAWSLPAGADTAPNLHVGAQIMFYGGDLIDLATAVIIMTTWYRATGRELARQDRRRHDVTTRSQPSERQVSGSAAIVPDSSRLTIP